MSVGLGMPPAPPPVLAPRRVTRQLMVRDVGVGSDYPIAVQSMCTTKTHDINWVNDGGTWKLSNASACVIALSARLKAGK